MSTPEATVSAITYHRVGYDGWRRLTRDDEANLLTDGALWVTGPADTSPTFLGYNARCSACWLNHSHSVALHTVRVAR